MQPKYEMIPIAVTYNLASITKMINSQLNNMDERLNSLGTQVAKINRKVSLGVSTEELHTDPAPSQLSKATQSPPHA